MVIPLLKMDHTHVNMTTAKYGLMGLSLLILISHIDCNLGGSSKLALRTFQSGMKDWRANIPWKRKRFHRRGRRKHDALQNISYETEEETHFIPSVLKSPAASGQNNTSLYSGTDILKSLVNNSSYKLPDSPKFQTRPDWNKRSRWRGKAKSSHFVQPRYAESEACVIKMCHLRSLSLEVSIIYELFPIICKSTC